MHLTKDKLVIQIELGILAHPLWVLHDRVTSDAKVSVQMLRHIVNKRKALEA